MLTRLKVQSGVSLIEMMVGIAIVAVIFAMGVPSFSTFIQNSKIRNAAEAIQNGLNQARAEAVRRNANVHFTLGTNSSWTVGCVTAVGTSCPAIIQARSEAEGSTNVTVASSPATPIAFNGLGRVVTTSLAAGATAVINLTNPSGGSCAPSGPMRCLRIIVSSGGQIRMCDPAAASGSPQGC